MAPQTLTPRREWNPVQWTIALAILATPVAGLSEPAPSRQTVIVAGCENRIPDKKWKDPRIGFGVIDLLAQNLYDSGGFALLEEKEEIRRKLRDLRDRLWREGQKKTLAQARSMIDSAALAIGRLVYCGTPRTDVSIGPVHANRNEVVMKVEIDLILPKGRTITGRGQGTASRTAMSTLFEFRDDAVLFEQTMIGLALKQAVAAAVKDLVAIRDKENGR